jgi:16S rRNA (guanine966-N2)-methyltransferase
MRVIAGTLRSRPLKAPEGLATRPTSDRLREALFNVLAPRIEGTRFLDLYAGSGAVGIEALSRGATQVVFVERARAALNVLRGNLTRLGVSAGIGVRAGSVASYLSGPRAAAVEFDLVFLDPPYDAEKEYDSALGLLGGEAMALLARGAVVIAEHRRKYALADRYGALRRRRRLEHGDAALSFYAALETTTTDYDESVSSRALDRRRDPRKIVHEN